MLGNKLDIIQFEIAILGITLLTLLYCDLISLMFCVIVGYLNFVICYLVKDVKRKRN